MCQIFSRIKPENVVVEYVHTGLGYAGRPGGPIPTIRLQPDRAQLRFPDPERLHGPAGDQHVGPDGDATAEDLSGK